MSLELLPGSRIGAELNGISNFAEPEDPTVVIYGPLPVRHRRRRSLRTVAQVVALACLLTLLGALL